MDVLLADTVMPSSHLEAKDRYGANATPSIEQFIGMASGLRRPRQSCCAGKLHTTRSRGSTSYCGTSTLLLLDVLHCDATGRFGGLINFVLRYLEENGGIPRIRDARLTELIRGGIDPLTGRFLAYLVLSSSSGFLHAHVRHTALAAS